MTDEGPRFPPRGRRLVYVAIADVLARRIEDGTYPPDGRLPAELDLAAEFGASRESVRRAMDQLRKRGWIETVKGKGHFVTRPEERALGSLHPQHRRHLVQHPQHGERPEKILHVGRDLPGCGTRRPAVGHVLEHLIGAVLYAEG